MENKTLDRRKIELIVQISKLDNEYSVSEVENAVNLLARQPTDEQLEIIKKISQPIRKKLIVEDLIREQNWKPATQAEIDELVDKIDLQEPLEQLLADI